VPFETPSFVFKPLSLLKVAVKQKSHQLSAGRRIAWLFPGKHLSGESLPTLSDVAPGMGRSLKAAIPCNTSPRESRTRVLRDRNSGHLKPLNLLNNVYMLKKYYLRLLRFDKSISKSSNFSASSTD